jgi:predicted enzyme related to lactoylglutathione lyase
MPALSLDHWNIYCKDLDATVRFYERYVGLTNGDRPPFMFPGAWMYAGDKAILHIVSETDRKDHGSGAIDHVAINCSDIRGTIDQIKKGWPAVRGAQGAGAAPAAGLRARSRRRHDRAELLA